jgi:hypothetical protein
VNAGFHVSLRTASYSVLAKAVLSEPPLVSFRLISPRIASVRVVFIFAKAGASLQRMFAKDVSACFR